MKNILLLVHGDAGQEARLQCALDLTRALGGHLRCLDVALRPATFAAPYDGLALGVLLEDEERHEFANKQRLQARLAKEDVPWSWDDVTGEFENELREAARLADVIVVNRALRDDYPAMRRVASDLIIKARRPILAVPEDARKLDLFGHALVAWDGSTAASAALLAAVPLLRLAEQVTVLQIDDGSIDTQAEEAGAYLSREAIEARIVKIAPEGRSVGDILIEAVARYGAGYMVMGGFGHARLLEAIFGGATRFMLSQSPVPLLVVHE